MSTGTITDNVSTARYEFRMDGELAGYLEYHLRGSEIALLHTAIDSPYSGKGLGETLVRGVLDDVRRRGLHVLPVCAFVRKFITKNQSYLELVPAQDRGQFSL